MKSAAFLRSLVVEVLSIVWLKSTIVLVEVCLLVWTFLIGSLIANALNCNTLKLLVVLLKGVFVKVGFDWVLSWLLL
jgi:uncharacterized membrane protein